MEDTYTGTTPTGRRVSGRLEREEGASYIVTSGKDGEVWYMVHTSSVRKEGDNGTQG